MVGWPALPASFLEKVSIEGVDLELAYKGGFGFELWNGSERILSPPTELQSPSGEIATEQYELSPAAPAGPFELRLLNFSSGDSLYYARLRIHFRGPLLERAALPGLPATNSGWPSTAKLADADPSSCEAPASDTPPPLEYPTPPDVEGAIAIEVSAAVQSITSSGRATLALGAFGTGPTFRLGPNGLVSSVTSQPGWARLRFVTFDTAFTTQVSYESQGFGSPVKLCHLERTLLRMRDQLDLVLETGVRERFTREGAEWKGAPGVRSALTDQPGGGYLVTRPDGSTLEFAEPRAGGEWRLSRLADAQGRGLTLSYDAGTGQLDRVTEDGAPSRYLEFEYEPARPYLTQISDWTGRAWSYTVDPRGDLAEAKDALAVARGWPGVRYDYQFEQVENPDLAHNLLKIVYPEDRNGDGQGDRFVEFTYYHDDKVASHTDSRGHTQTFLFNVPRLENQTTDPRGFTTVYRHDTDGNLVQRRDPDGAVWAWEYNGDRNVISETDPFGRTRQFLDFDEKGNPRQIVDRDGKLTEIEYDDLTGAPREIVDKRGNTRTITFAGGLPVESSATIGGLATVLSTSEYDPTSRRLTRTTEELGDGTGRVRDTRFFYEAPGDPTDRDLSRVESYDENGNVIAAVEYEYDPEDLGRRRFERVRREVSASDPTLIELVTETIYNERDQVERIVRPDGTVQVADYDRNGNLKIRLLEEHRPDGEVVEHGRTQYVYDELDRLVALVDAGGGTTTYEYDAAGNPVAMTDPEGNTWRTEYDPMNRPVRGIDPNRAVTEAVYDAAGRVVATIDPTGIQTVREYDEIGRLVAYTYADKPEATREVVYGMDSAGNNSPTAYHEVIEDPMHRITKYDFDDLGRVSLVRDAANGVAQMTYNLLGSPRIVTDPIGKQTVFSFDTLGRTTSVNPYYTANVEAFAYDRTGNVIRRTAQDGCALDLVYDAMGRLVSRFTSNAETCPRAPVDDAFGYDARGLLVAAQNENDSTGLIREHDALGRLVREIDTRFGTGVGYAWDGASRLTSKVYPDGSVVHYAYDGAGRTVGISDPFGDTTRFVYDGAGRRLQRLGTSGLRVDYTYHTTTGWLSGIKSQAAPPVGSGLSLQYPAYDDVGNRLSANDLSGTTTYGYDALDRLATLDPPDAIPPNPSLYPANGAPTEFAYDAAGNRTDFGPTSGGAFVSPHRTYTYGPARRRLHEILEDGQVVESFSYDVNGQAVGWTPPGASERTLGYDALGRLVSITGGFTANYAYDPFGRRIEKSEAGSTTRYQYDGLHVVAEYDGSGLAASYVFEPGIDEVIKLRRGTTVAAYHTDALGSVIVISSGGSFRNSYRYDAFGKPVFQGGNGPLPNAYTYTGRELDASGLYYYRARYYHPDAGRFLTPDPIGLAGGTNAYAYVDSNPTNYTDPFGLISIAKTSLGPAAPNTGISLFGSDSFGGLLGGASGGYGFSEATESSESTPFRPDAFEVSGAIGLGVVGGAKARFTGAGEFEGFSLFGGIGAAARVQGAGAAGASASKQLPGVSEGSLPRITLGSIFSASLIPISPVSATLGFDTEIGSGGFVNAQGTGGITVGTLPVLVCAPCVSVNFTGSESRAILRGLLVPPELLLMAPDVVP